MSKVTRLKPVAGGKQRAPGLPRPLEQVRDAVTEHAGTLLSEMLDGADDTLFDLSEKETDSERDRYFDAMRELRLQRAGLEAGFRRNVQELFQECARGREQAESVTDRTDVENLALVKEDELETSVALDNLARRAHNACHEGLRVFLHRLDYLFEGRHEFSEKTSPLEPRNLAGCFAQCLERLSLDIRARLIVLKLFERVVMDEAASLVDLANRTLANAGILPDMKTAPVPNRGDRRSGRRSGFSRDPHDQNDNIESADIAAEAAPGGSELARESNGQMFHLLQELLTTLRSGGAPAAPATDAAPPPAATTGAMAVIHNGTPWLNGAPMAGDTPVQTVDSTDLFGLLTRLQRLEHALEGEPGDDRSVKEGLSDLLESEHGEAIHALEQADDDVINLVSMLFDFILDDEGLPSEIKALIGRLQIPLLKVAIADKTFFSNDSHEARLLLNTLARAGCQWDPQQGRDDEIYQRIDRAVHAIIDDYDEDAGLFRDLLDDFEDFFQSQRQRAERVAERVREVEEGKARSEQARDSVAEFIQARVAGRDLPPVVSRLLGQGWQQVLYLTWLRDGGDSEAWRRHAKVVDALVWSAAPKSDPAEHSKLAEVAPKVRRAVAHGLGGIEYDKSEIRALTDELETLHQALINGDAPDDAEPDPASRGSGFSRDNAPSPDHVATTPPSDHAPSPDNATTAPPPSLPDDHELTRQARHLKAGQWIQLGDGDQAQRAKLAANIRDGAKLVFVNRRGIKISEFTAGQFAHHLDAGDATLIDDGALFDRALEAVIGDLRRNLRA